MTLLTHADREARRGPIYRSRRSGLVDGLAGLAAWAAFGFILMTILGLVNAVP